MISACDNPPPGPAKRRLQLEAVVEAGDWPDSVVSEPFLAGIAAAIEATLDFERREAAVVAFADDDAVRALNKRFRHRDKATNVLSFPAPQPAADLTLPEASAMPLGDIVLARQTVSREAAEQAIDFSDHTTHLIVHGVLHLVGYDHETTADAEEMEALEIEILARLGVENPYTEELLGPD